MLWGAAGDSFRSEIARHRRAKFVLRNEQICSREASGIQTKLEEGERIKQTLKPTGPLPKPFFSEKWKLKIPARKSVLSLTPV
jgi:hypothetical protein